VPTLVIEDLLTARLNWSQAEAAFAGMAVRILAIAALMILGRALVYMVFKRMNKADNMLATRLLRQAIMVLVYCVGIASICAQIPGLSTAASSLLAGSGILALVVGFASQASFANVAAGVFLLLSHPFRVGDFILIAVIGHPVKGEVLDITLRHTILRAQDGHRITVPNAVVNSAVIERLESL